MKKSERIVFHSETIYFSKICLMLILYCFVIYLDIIENENKERFPLSFHVFVKILNTLK